MANNSDERRPLLGEREDDDAVPTKRVYAAVTIVERDGSVTPDEAPGDAAETETGVESAAKAANVRMAKLIFPLAIGIFLAAMDGTIVASSYASIGSELKQLQNTSWIATGYMLTLTSFQPLYGKMSDIFGRKACLVFAYTVFAIGCLLCGLARNMTELIAARTLAGLGGGGMTTVVSILVSDIVPLRSRGTWQGVLNIIFATGSAVGAPLGGILADGIGWRWAFLIQVPFTVLAIVVVSLTLTLPKQAEDEPSSPSSQNTLRSKLARVDFLGALTLVSAVFALLLALDRGANGTRGWSSPLPPTLLGVSTLAFVLFFLAETHPKVYRAREPLAPARILFARSLAAAYACNLFAFAASMCAVFHVALHAQAVLRVSASGAGLRLLPAVLGGVLGSLAGGLVMQRTGRYFWVTAGAYAAEVLGTGALALSTGVDGALAMAKYGLVVGLFVMSVGNGSGTTTTLIAIIANAAPADQAVATAVSYLFRSLGSVLGISLGSTLVQHALASRLRVRLVGQGVDVEDIIAQARSSLSFLDDEALPLSVQNTVRGAYAEAITAAFWLATACACAAAVCALFIKEKPLTRRTGAP